MQSCLDLVLVTRSSSTDQHSAWLAHFQDPMISYICAACTSGIKTMTSNYVFDAWHKILSWQGHKMATCCTADIALCGALHGNAKFWTHVWHQWVYTPWTLYLIWVRALALSWPWPIEITMVISLDPGRLHAWMLDQENSHPIVKPVPDCFVSE